VLPAGYRRQVVLRGDAHLGTGRKRGRAGKAGKGDAIRS
jgi:hypothetical protein